MADGKQKNDESGRWIPESRRPDGSIRKARRVKDGYIPPEEAPKYESKGKQWVNTQPSLPPGFYQEPEKTEQTLSKNQKKNQRKKHKRAEKTIEEQQEKTKDIEQEVEKVTTELQRTSLREITEEEVAKKIRTLKKKIRQIEDLQAKIDSGEIQNPEKNQLDKLEKRAELENELESLEAM